MASVVFLRGINVGGANLCKPALLAKKLSKFDVVNIGAVGTFVVKKRVADSTLRRTIAAQLAKDFKIKCEIMIVSAKSIVDLGKNNRFAGHPESSAEITHFVSVLHKRPQKLPALPLCLPSDKDWLFKIIAIPDRFVIGLYRRQMKAIGYLGKIEKILGVPATTRSWNTIDKVVEILRQDEQD